MHIKDFIQSGKTVRAGILILDLIVSYFLLFLLFDIIFPLKPEIEYSPLILSRENTLLHGFLTSDDKWRMYTKLDEITPELRKAIIYKEDKFFFYHFGINPVSIIKASFNNLKTGKRTSGASTITMQVARMIEPKSRTYANKIKEIFRAMQLEVHLSKQEILQLYLNLVPYGSNIEGVKSASVIFLGKMPNHLSIAEIATLSIIPNRPVSLHLGKNNSYIVKERNKWLKKYKKAHLFEDQFIQDALSEPLNAMRGEVPRLAPHFSYRLKQKYPDKSIIISSLNAEMQFKAEKIVKEYSQRFYFSNIRNATALIIDNATGQVFAYIGSSDFENQTDGGQVDGIRAIRSPGSTLKPILYGIAFDKGLITPKLVITDVPSNFGGYEPENYDDKFYGNITIEEALARSLNIPAVKILQDLRLEVFINYLIETGFEQIKKEKNNLGFSLILGGCGTNLEEITAMYCCIANSGIYYPLCYLTDDKKEGGTRIISRSAAYMITEILTQLKRPDLPLSWSNSMHMPKIAWKTGTSYGRKDAWSIGFNNHYTIGVWTGNFSGEGVPELNGTDIATPLLFQLFNAIDYDTKKEWFRMPKELQMRYVCSQTGLRPNDYCEDLVIDYFIPEVSGNKLCNHLKKVFISPDSCISYCSYCKPELGYITAYYPNLAPEIITYYDANNIRYLKIPPHNPECDRLICGSNPQITSPINENNYYVNILDSMEIMLSCNTANDVGKVFWYIDKQFYKEAKANEKLFFKPRKGKVEISCSDDKGRNSDITIYVKYTSF